MPEVDGFQVLEEKQTSLNADTPTFVVSNLDAEADYQKAIDLGATKCFLKARVTLKGLVEEIVEELDK